MCSNLGGFDEEFSSNDSRVGWLIILGCVHCLHLSNLFLGNLDELLWFFQCSLRWTFSGVKSAGILKSLKIWLYVSLEMELGPCLHYGFLATAPLSLHSFPSQVNCSDLSFGTHGMSWRLMSRNKRQRNRTKQKQLLSLGAPQTPAWFHANKIKEIWRRRKCFVSVMRVYIPRFFVSSQQRFGMTDIKAPLAGHSSQVLDRPCYSSQVSNGPCYSS